MQSTLAQEFNDTATAAYAAFPRQLDKLVILLVPSSDRPVYVSPAIVDQLTKDTAVIKKAIANVTDVMYNLAALGLAGQQYSLAGTIVNLIALNDENPIGVFSRLYTKDMSIIYILDHEIGHHILKNGYRSLTVSAHEAESAADAFGMLRHIQRFGKNTGHAGGYGKNRANSIVLRADTSHYTTDSVEGAIRYSEKTDISNLSLQETAELAEKITAECHLDEATLEKIRDAFSPVYEASKAQFGGEWEIGQKFYTGDKEAYGLFCRETLAVMRKHSGDADIFKAGERFLSYPPIKRLMTEAAKTDPYYQEALGFINNTRKRAKALRQAQKRLA